VLAVLGHALPGGSALLGGDDAVAVRVDAIEQSEGGALGFGRGQAAVMVGIDLGEVAEAHPGETAAAAAARALGAWGGAKRIGFGLGDGAVMVRVGKAELGLDLGSHVGSGERLWSGTIAALLGDGGGGDERGKSGARE
jgi:hypothetical protein